MAEEVRANLEQLSKLGLRLAGRKDSYGPEMMGNDTEGEFLVPRMETGGFANVLARDVGDEGRKAVGPSKLLVFGEQGKLTTQALLPRSGGLKGDESMAELERGHLGLGNNLETGKHGELIVLETKLTQLAEGIEVKPRPKWAIAKTCRASSQSRPKDSVSREVKSEGPNGGGGHGPPNVVGVPKRSRSGCRQWSLIAQEEHKTRLLSANSQQECQCGRAQVWWREENWKCRDNLKGDGVPTVAERDTAGSLSINFVQEIQESASKWGGSKLKWVMGSNLNRKLDGINLISQERNNDYGKVELTIGNDNHERPRPHRSEVGLGTPRVVLNVGDDDNEKGGDANDQKYGCRVYRECFNEEEQQSPMSGTTTTTTRTGWRVEGNVEGEDCGDGGRRILKSRRFMFGVGANTGGGGTQVVSPRRWRRIDGNDGSMKDECKERAAGMNDSGKQRCADAPKDVGQNLDWQPSDRSPQTAAGVVEILQDLAVRRESAEGWSREEERCAGGMDSSREIQWTSERKAAESDSSRINREVAKG
ncbi:hypothetical protein C8J57DRAFT_1227866 [Mycena rebaudengoi]|nr:hypothetical protein C8J57DRAFT_1227866 [Mycena rebaudengoi]